MDVGDLVPMLADYCTFYRVDPGRERLEALVRELLERPEEGGQLIAHDEDREATAFATFYWTWNTLVADRVAVLHDLFVRPEHRGHGVGRALIDACLDVARERGVARLMWNTEPGNATAQRLYDSLPGVERSDEVTYSLDVPA